MDKTTPHPLFKLATELGPLMVFFVANAKFNLFVATGAFMVAIDRGDDRVLCGDAACADDGDRHRASSSSCSAR